ncbi:MAG: beta-ketoacyl synthase N-terminal-like domain-containing protein, partial [Pleurocapsa sp. MO_226.B13]|nr:beta-ketoacyl synthase N-terminal-like domain-containing protein [Pleurocapsa sp. MO_226.B13]
MPKTSIAIVGMSGIFPQAKNLRQYWSNIVNEVDCITDVPPSRWNVDDYYDPDPHTPDKTYCKRGGFIPDINFNPLEFGLPPNILEVTDISQLLSLVVAKEALADAGYQDATESVRQRTGVVLGVAVGKPLFAPLANRLQYPIWERVLRSNGIPEGDIARIIEQMKLAYVPWTENSFPGLLSNVVSGRVANRLDLGGMNCVVDAACASSLSALRMAISELEEHRSDMMITGGVDTDNTIFMYMSFSKTPAFSRQGQIKPFSADSDGMLIGEALGMMVLKRLADAERDGDRIYAVIKGMGTSSDGKYKSIYAPRSSGQAVALRRAYQDAGFPAQTVSLVEAHGTGTMAGDPAEFMGLKEVFGENNPQKSAIALGSVKSQIGHTKGAAGAVSLIKVALGLHHRVLPPTINVTKPNPKLEIEDSPFYLNTKTRPWLTADGTPRRAGVSSFGFGGTNFHVVLEEYRGENKFTNDNISPQTASILVSANTPESLLAKCQGLLKELATDSAAEIHDKLIEDSHNLTIPVTNSRVGWVTESLGETITKLKTTIATLEQYGSHQSWDHPQGIYYRRGGVKATDKVVALFSGQGSQYVEMGRELAIRYPEIHQAFEQMDRILTEDKLTPISQLVFPPPVFSQTEKETQTDKLNRTENAQPAIGAFGMGLYNLFQNIGFQPDLVAGHSFGELTALWAAKVLSDRDYCFLVKSRGQAMATNSTGDGGKMLAVKGDSDRLEQLISNLENITIANRNSPRQVVLAGQSSSILLTKDKLDSWGFDTVLLPVSAAFHTPLVSHAQQPFATALNSVKFHTPQIPVYSNTTANLYPQDSQEIERILAQQMLEPVDFKTEIENIYQAGGRVFVEFGVRNILTNLVADTLGDRPHTAICLHRKNKKQPTSDRLFQQAIVQLRVLGLPLNSTHKNLSPTKAQPSHKGFNIQLNGANYVSDRTKDAFTNALGDRIKNPRSDIAESNKQRQDEEFFTSTEPSFSSKEKASNQRDKRERPNRKINPSDPPQNKTAMNKSSQPNNSHLQSNFAELLMRFQEHQTQVNQVHQQYLDNQAAYTQQFLELLQQSPSRSTSNPAESDLESIATSNNSDRELPNSSSKYMLEAANTSFDLAAEEGEIVAVEEDRETREAEEQREQREQREGDSNPPANIELNGLAESLLSVVSEKTGYPVAMLELDMDMEADLGIDSIKRVEILGAMQSLHPDLPPVNPEELAQLRTLRQIVDRVAQNKITSEGNNGHQSNGSGSIDLNNKGNEGQQDKEIKEPKNTIDNGTSTELNGLAESLLSVVS